MATMACQWSGVAMTTASMSLRAAGRGSRCRRRSPCSAALLVLGVAFLDGLLGVLAAGGVHVADGDDLHVLLAQEVAEVAAVHRAHADEAERDALAGRGLVGVAQGRAGHDQWSGKSRGGRGLDELPASDSPFALTHGCPFLAGPAKPHPLKAAPGCRDGCLRYNPGRRRLQLPRTDFPPARPLTSAASAPG